MDVFCVEGWKESTIKESGNYSTSRDFVYTFATSAEAYEFVDFAMKVNDKVHWIVNFLTVVSLDHAIKDFEVSHEAAE